MAKGRATKLSVLAGATTAGMRVYTYMRARTTCVREQNRMCTSRYVTQSVAKLGRSWPRKVRSWTNSGATNTQLAAREQHVEVPSRRSKASKLRHLTTSRLSAAWICLSESEPCEADSGKTLVDAPPRAPRDPFPDPHGRPSMERAGSPNLCPSLQRQHQACLWNAPCQRVCVCVNMTLRPAALAQPVRTHRMRDAFGIHAQR